MPRSNVEYADDQITVYRYCPYKCKYCYVWTSKLFTYRVKVGKYDPIEEALKYYRKKQAKTIVVSFVSDPYPPEEEKLRKTCKVLNALCMSKQHKILILTKNPTLGLKDIKENILLRTHPKLWLGTTLTSLRKTEWEPNAPKPEERINALELANMYVKTWISMEPIIPNITNPIEIIERTKLFTDWYVLGALNYYTRFGFTENQLKEYYNKYVIEAIKLLKTLGKPYYVKSELLRLLDKERILEIEEK